MRKKGFLCLLIIMSYLPVVAQHIVYSGLKELLAEKGDTVPNLQIEKRSKNQIALTGGADYRIVSDHNESMSRWLKRHTFAVRDEAGNLYLNCKRLRYKRLRFGSWYAPAIRLGDHIYFSAMPLGSAIGSNFVKDDDVRLGGQVGDALAASSLVGKRVCYELNGETGKVSFLNSEQVSQLLEQHPDLKQQYLREESPEAECVFHYLQELQKEKEE